MSDFHRSMRKKAEERVEMLEKKLKILQAKFQIAVNALLVANEINHEPGCLATFASHDGCDCAKSTVRDALVEIGKLPKCGKDAVYSALEEIG